MNYITFNGRRTFVVWAGKVCRWSALRRIGGLPLMRATIFAPLIAYLILFNDYAINLIEKVSITAGDNAPSPLNFSDIYFLYYGLIFIGIGSILYAMACGLPPEKWSSAMFRKTEEDHGEQAPEA